MRTKRHSLRAVGLACALLAPLSATARVPERTSPTNGVKVGDGRMHLYFDLETRADSAASLEPPPPATSATTRARALEPEIILHLRPGLDLQVPGSDVAVRLGAFFDYVWHTALLTNDSNYLSRPEGALELDLTFNGKGPVSLKITDSFYRSDEVEVPAFGVGTLTAYNEARAALPIKPGGGALEITPSGAFRFEFFMPTYEGVNPTCPGTNTACTPGYFSYLNAQGAVNARWQFFPKTALLLDATYDYRYFLYHATDSARLLKVQLGVAGLISPKIGLTVKGGYAHNFGFARTVNNVELGQDTRDFVAQAEFAYLPSETISLKLGYLRLFEPISVYHFYTDDRAYLDGRALLGGRLALTAGASFDYMFFRDPMREDLAFRFRIGPEYQFTPWLVGAAGYILTTHDAPYLPAIPALNYVRNEGYVRLTVSY